MKKRSFVNRNIFDIQVFIWIPILPAIQFFHRHFFAELCFKIAIKYTGFSKSMKGLVLYVTIPTYNHK